MKKVIITGVSEGLWYEVARKLLRKWVTIIWLSRKNPDLDIIYYKVDFNNESETIWVIDKIKKNHSDFDTLINCAWILSIQELQNISINDVKKLFDVNVFAPIMLISSLADIIRDSEWDIVNVSSTVWLKAYQSQLAYWASKWAIRWVTENLQLEFKGTKVRVIWFNPWGFQSWIFAKATWVPIDSLDLSTYMKADEVADILIQTLELPKNMEVSSITINRK